MKNTKIGWMCNTAFDWELGETYVTVYPSEEALKKCCPCVKGQSECTAVRVRIVEDKDEA